MSKKKISVDGMVNELKGASLYFQKRPSSPRVEEGQQTDNHVAQKDAWKHARHVAQIRKDPRITKNLSSYPSLGKDEIEEFSFTLRREHTVQVQALLPEDWKRELEDMAHDLHIGKLELYRFIYGEFLGKVKRQSST
jgi:hypothetical protein